MINWRMTTLPRLLFAVLMVMPVSSAGSAFAFGTIRSMGQNAEHGRITRLALECGTGAQADDCFEPKSLDNLAGARGSFGAVGAPDRGRLSFQSDAHCSSGDYFDVEGYPQSRAEAQRILSACRDFMQLHMDAAVEAAGGLLDADGAIRGSEIPTYIDCNFAGSISGRAKCNVIAHFGYLLHAAEDFYAHTNWVDRADPDRAISPDNPPGLDKSGPAPWLDLRQRNAAFPKGLISGCFETGSFISEADYCVYGADKARYRVRHLHLNKDLGAIGDGPAVGTTERGASQGNFKRAVEAAVADAADKWATLRELLVARYGAERAGMMVCALTRDDPTKVC